MNTLQKNVTSTIKSVDKALEVLEAFSELDGGIKLSCLSEKLKMNKSGVYRLLQVFKQRGYIEQKSKHGKYQLGTTSLTVADKIAQQMISLTEFCNPYFRATAAIAKAPAEISLLEAVVDHFGKINMPLYQEEVTAKEWLYFQ
jgi:DNA-binding IclR family transcriptional regulator